MCDLTKYNKIFEDIKKLTSQDILQLALEATSKEEKDFYIMIGNYLLQSNQKKVIERNLF